MQPYDRTGAWQQGYEDAINGHPRAYGYGASYRQGYDRGLTQVTSPTAYRPDRDQPNPHNAPHPSGKQS